LPHPTPTSSSVALRALPPDTGVPEVVSVPISAPDWTELCPDWSELRPTLRIAVGQQGPPRVGPVSSFASRLAVGWHCPHQSRLWGVRKLYIGPPGRAVSMSAPGRNRPRPDPRARCQKILQCAAREGARHVRFWPIAACRRGQEPHLEALSSEATLLSARCRNAK